LVNSKYEIVKLTCLRECLLNHTNLPETTLRQFS